MFPLKWGAHAPRAFRSAPSRIGVRRSKMEASPIGLRPPGFREGAGRVRSPANFRRVCRPPDLCLCRDRRFVLRADSGVDAGRGYSQIVFMPASPESFADWSCDPRRAVEEKFAALLLIEKGLDLWR